MTYDLSLLKELLPKNSAVVIAGASTQYRNADSSHAFRQDSNFWYLSGFNEAESTLVLLINKENDVESIVFVPEKNELKEIWDGYRAGPEGAIKDYGFDLAFNNTEINKMTDLPRVVAESDVGSVAIVELWRKNKIISIEVKLGELPEESFVAVSYTHLRAHET